MFYWRCEYLAAKLLSSRDNLSFAKRRWVWSSQQGHSEGHLSFQHQDHFADIVRQSSLNLHVVGPDISVIKHFWRRWLGQTNTNCICAVELCIFSISTLALHEIAKPSIPARDAAALRFRFRCVSWSGSIVIFVKLTNCVYTDELRSKSGSDLPKFPITPTVHK